MTREFGVDDGNVDAKTSGLRYRGKYQQKVAVGMRGRCSPSRSATNLLTPDHCFRVSLRYRIKYWEGLTEGIAAC